MERLRRVAEGPKGEFTRVRWAGMNPLKGLAGAIRASRIIAGILRVTREWRLSDGYVQRRYCMARGLADGLRCDGGGMRPAEE